MNNSANWNKMVITLAGVARREDGTCATSMSTMPEQEPSTEEHTWRKI